VKAMMSGTSAERRDLHHAGDAGREHEALHQPGDDLSVRPGYLGQG
jgi:hypothetical protein